MAMIPSLKYDGRDTSLYRARFFLKLYLTNLHTQVDKKLHLLRFNENYSTATCPELAPQDCFLILRHHTSIINLN